MDRRDAIARVALLMGGTVIGADFFLTSCSSPGKETAASAGGDAATAAAEAPNFSIDQVRLLDEVGETIIPTTSTPGAKAAHVGRFMSTMVRDCYTPADQKIFMAGIEQLDKDCAKKTGKGFLACDAAERTSFLTALDKEQKEYTANQGKDGPSKGSPAHYFRMMKQLTLLGFFTSEVGATKTLRYLPVPGRYDGNVPYKKGDKAWATS